MQKTLAIAVCSIFLAAISFAQVDGEKKPDTVFQKMADYSEGGYQKTVEPVKKVTIFQIMADWVNGHPLTGEVSTAKKQ